MGKVPRDCPQEDWKKKEPCGGIPSFPHTACIECRVPIPVGTGRAIFPRGLLLPMGASSAEIDEALAKQVVVVYSAIDRVGKKIGYNWG
ncbi:MAG: hypothetical protein WAV41_01160 [Microgenomates group bacterium]